MSRVLEVPFGQLGDMTKRQAMNLSILRVNDGESLSTTYEQARKTTSMLPTTSPKASLLKSQAPHTYSDTPAPPMIRDSSFARWDIVPLPGGLTLDEVLQHVVRRNKENRRDRILKIKVRFSDASEITFVRQDVAKPDSLRFSGFYSALNAGVPAVPSGPNANPLAKSASAAFQRRGVRLPSLNDAVTYPSRESRLALFKRFDPNGNGLLSLAELDKAIGELWPAFNNKPAIMRAYKSADLDGSGLLGFSEFEHFLRFLVNFTKVWTAFKKQDTNDDRRVNLEEFIAGGSRLEPNKTEAELTAMFKKADKNGGGIILFDEFVALMVERRSNVLGHVPPTPVNRLAKTAPMGASRTIKSKRVPQLEMPTAARRKQLFSRFDPNGNGLLSLAELDKGVLELWPAFNNKPALMRAYKASDANGTGFVGKREFEYFIRYLVHFNNLWAAFTESDKDNDRRITLQEFLAVRDRLQVGSEAEARMAFAQMDRNHGGYVLFEEFCDWMAKHKAEYELKFTQPKPTPKKASSAKKPKKPTRDFNLSNLQSTGMKAPSVEDRAALWRRSDFNGNGMCSLAELDKVVLELWPRFNNKPALMRAYKAADKSGNGFVSKKEFNFFLDFLVHYNNLWQAFDHIDKDDDRRVTLAEFMKGADSLRIRKSPEELQQVFESMDNNGGGYVLFDEFCAALAELKAATG